MEFWKDLINLNESKKPSDKFLRVWAKNQLGFENFKIYMQKSQWKIAFLSIFLQFSRTFSFYTSVTYQNFWGWLGGGTFRRAWEGVLSNLGGLGGCINPCIIFYKSEQLQW